MSYTINFFIIVYPYVHNTHVINVGVVSKQIYQIRSRSLLAFCNFPLENHSAADVDKLKTHKHFVKKHIRSENALVLVSTAFFISAYAGLRGNIFLYSTDYKSVFGILSSV